MRSIHRNLLLVGVALVSAGVVAQFVPHGQQAASNDYPNPYKMENFGQLPAGRKIGQAYGIDIDRDGKSVWVFERCGGATCDGSPLAPLLKFDSSGRVFAMFGSGMFVYPHGLFVDADDNLWVTDGQAKNGKGQQVFEFSPTGRLILTLGTAGGAGNGPPTLNQPAARALTPHTSLLPPGHRGR